jgi:signal transduction histidine kinase/AmiR/NasT family two-component response regulator
VTVVEARKWLRVFHVLLFLSSACWIPIALDFTEGTQMQQLISGLCLIFMSSGSVCLYAGSLPTIFIIVWPALLPWIASLLMAEEHSLNVVGVMAGIYFLIGTQMAITLSRYMASSLRTTLEYGNAKEELRESNEKLSMALESSSAMTWSWDLDTRTVRCEGDFRAFGNTRGFVEGHEDQYLALVDPLMRANIRASLIGAMGAQGEIETEHLLQLPGRGTVYLAIRGRAYRNGDDEIAGFKGICWDATGKRTEEVLRHERDVQEAANKAKSVFLANASHEMRTPLAAISGYTDALLDSTLPPQIRQDLQVVQRTGRYLTSLVNDFLDLSRIETGQLYIQKNTINLEKEISEVMQIIKPALDAKNLNLALEVTTLLPERIESDQTRLRQILINLLSNASKYTETGEVRVRVSYDLKSKHKGTLSVRVIDTGVGITEQVRQSLFRPFARGETAFIKRTEGAGLGLALSRSLARALGGDLQLIRSAPNQGSEFEFSLAIETAAVPNLKVVEPHKETAVKSGTRALEDVRILVAEDSEDLRELMERILRAKGGDVDSCGDGAQAVDLALRNKYDVILMDINMPIMDGYQATASLRAKGYSGPVVALTAHASIEHRQMSLEAGCDAYLSKPINANGLIEVLRKCVTTSRDEKQHPPEVRLDDTKAAPVALAKNPASGSIHSISEI